MLRAGAYALALAYMRSYSARMEILKRAQEEASKNKKRFLLIGGHALNVQGVSRSTADLDLMVEAQDAPFWRDFLAHQGYSIFHETASFIQSKAPALTSWPIDPMLVSEATMTKALRDAVTTDSFGAPVSVASVGSLIAMKLHALKYVDAVRALKDEGDLLALLELAGLAVDSGDFRQMCEKYGTLEVYERFARFKK